MDGGSASAAAPNPSPQLRTSCSTRSHCARLVSWNSSTSTRSEEHTSELQSRRDLVCRLLLPCHPTLPLLPYTTLFRSLRPSPRRRRHGTRKSIASGRRRRRWTAAARRRRRRTLRPNCARAARRGPIARGSYPGIRRPARDRKSTRLNSSHVEISYAVFCCRVTPLSPSSPTRRSSDLFVHHRDVGFTQPVNRLLPVADDEDGRRQRVGGRAEPFAPTAHELRDEVPLRAARILEFVDQHVPVARLDPEAALRELVHLP